MKEKTVARITMRFNKTMFEEIATWATKSGKRGIGVVLYRTVHGFPVANTKSLTKYFRFLHTYYKTQEPRRLEEASRLKADMLAAQKAIEELGV